MSERGHLVCQRSAATLRALPRRDFQLTVTSFALGCVALSSGIQVDLSGTGLEQLR